MTRSEVRLPLQYKPVSFSSLRSLLDKPDEVRLPRNKQNKVRLPSNKPC